MKINTCCFTCHIRKLKVGGHSFAISNPLGDRYVQGYYKKAYIMYMNIIT